MKSGDRVHAEAGGDAFIRTICKLTHIGPNLSNMLKVTIHVFVIFVLLFFVMLSFINALNVSYFSPSCCRRWPCVSKLFSGEISKP